MPKVKLNFKKLRGSLSAKEIVNRKFANRVGREVVRSMLQDISKGKSPVKGVGRFIGYKAQRAGAADRERAKAARRLADKPTARRRERAARAAAKDPRFYPNMHKGKPKRPVNLSLEGKYLKELDHRRRKSLIEIGFFNFRGRTKDLFEAHNEGLNKAKKVPQRKHFPSKERDKFTVRINRIIRKLYSDRIKDIIRRS